MADSIYIVGGGPSLEGFDFGLLKDKNTIVINNSILNVPNPKYFITMDYTFYDYLAQKTKGEMTKERFSEFPCWKFFVIANSNDYISYENGHYVDKRFDYIYDLSGFSDAIEARYEWGIGTRVSDFTHGASSGYCAIQFALLLGYKNIYLLGYDLTINGAKTHYHSYYNHDKTLFLNRLNFYYDHFKFGFKDIKKKYPNVNIYNCSEISLLNYLIPYRDIKEVL